MEPKTIDLPVSVKERLLQLSANLPEPSRGDFLRNVTNRLSNVVLEHPNTIVFTALGWLLGEILDHLLAVHVPFSDIVLCLTGGKLSSALMVGGALYGVYRDIQKERLRSEIAQIVGEELRRALAQQGAP